MKVAIVGSSGYIAGFLINRFEKEHNIDSILKIDQNENADFFLNLQESHKFNYDVLNTVDYIVFTAAISGPDKCATEFELCWSINVVGTIFFIHEALNRGCKVLFFSSDAVYGDIPGAVYDEESKTEACTSYGKMKKKVEDEFKGNIGFKAIRLSYVVSAKDRFISYCLDCIKKGEIADVFHPFYRNCIVVSDVVNVVFWLMQHFDEYDPFVLNVAGPELVSRVRIADELNRCFEKKLQYRVSRPNKDFFANRPCITQMRSLYIHKYHILDELTFTEKIQKELKEIRL